jgi:NADPH:quinone reductase-like Zn-dependent oxidoreductase
MSTHTAIATTAKGVVSTIQVPTPTPGPSDVLLRIDYATLIAMDTWMVDEGSYVQSYPTTLGFNAAGTVVKTGYNVKDLQVGDRVSLSHQVES